MKVKKELIELFSGLEGCLIIKGSNNWARFMKGCGFTLKEFSATYKIGNLEIRYSENPHFLYNVIALE